MRTEANFRPRLVLPAGAENSTSRRSLRENCPTGMVCREGSCIEGGFLAEPRTIERRPVTTRKKATACKPGFHRSGGRCVRNVRPRDSSQSQPSGPAKVTGRHEGRETLKKSVTFTGHIAFDLPRQPPAPKPAEGE